MQGTPIRGPTQSTRGRRDLFTATAIRKHRDGILAADRLGLSNARFEGLNQRVALVVRRAFGFHSATAALALVMLSADPINLTLPSDKASVITHTHAGRASLPSSRRPLNHGPMEPIHRGVPLKVECPRQVGHEAVLQLQCPCKRSNLAPKCEPVLRHGVLLLARGC